MDDCTMAQATSWEPQRIVPKHEDIPAKGTTRPCGFYGCSKLLVRAFKAYQPGEVLELA